MTDSFIARMLPLINGAAEAARERAKQVILNGHILWQVYTHEKYRLIDDAVEVKARQRLRSGESMTEEQFEAYLLNRAVWVPLDDLTSDKD